MLTTLKPTRTTTTILVLRFLATLLFVAAGIDHFLKPEFFQRIVPPFLPWPYALVIISGIAEITGGIALLIPALRRPAAWGLILLLIAVFPANLYMAFNAAQFNDLHLPTWLFWARLPLQPLLIAYIWLVALKHPHPSKK